MMGIVNVTDDSFFEGSRVSGIEKAIELTDRHIEEGALIIDVGGESTRPGSAPVSEGEEIERICPVIEAIRNRYPDAVISADTYRAATARKAIASGADIINDISGFTFEPEIAGVIREEGVAAVIMHTGGRPDRMQDDPHYENVVEEVYGFLKRQIEYGESCGIDKDQMMIDVGIGFGKTDEHNLSLLKNIKRFESLGRPHLMAISRKSLIGRTLADACRENVSARAGCEAGGTDVKEPLPAEARLFGTAALTAYGAMMGLEAARVHDVRENIEAARMVEAVMAAR